jgi:hypothetical protein
MGIGAELKSDARAGVPQLLTVAVGGIELHLYQEMAATAPGFRDQNRNSLGACQTHCRTQPAAYHFSPSRFLVELYVDMDIFIPELNWFEPRPWHETLPLRPRAWSIDQITTWGTKYEFDFLTV